MIEAPDTEQQLDEFGEPIPTEEELAKQRADQEAERLKTEQALNLAGGMTGIESQLPNRLPTQTDPVSAPGPQLHSAYPASAPVMPPPQSSGSPAQDSAGLPLIDGNITPMPKAQESTAYPVYRGVSPPQESQSKYPIKQMLNLGMKPKDIMAVVDAKRRYDSERGYQADIAKGMTQTAAMAKWGPMLFSGSKGGASPRQTFHNVSGAGYSFDPTTGKANLVTPPSAPSARETLALEREKRLSSAADQQLPPASKEKVKQMGLDIAGLRKALMTGSLPPDTQRQYENDIATLNRMIADEYKKPAAATPAVKSPVSAPAPQGQPVKDKSGKTWIYTGSAADPKTDKDPSHWTAQ